MNKLKGLSTFANEHLFAFTMASTNALWWHLIIFLQIKAAILQKSAISDNKPSFYNIGGVLSNNESETHFHDTIAVSTFLYISFLPL